MLNKDKKQLNDWLMTQTGLELNEFNHVVDQDTGQELQIKGKSVRYNRNNIIRYNQGEIEFDPVDNPLIAFTICGNYLQKLDNEGTISADVYGITNKEKNTKGFASCRGKNGEIKGDVFDCDSLKYISLIAKINECDPDVNLKKLDVVPKTKRKK